MQIEQLKERLAINKGNLDEEISQQAMLFFEISEFHVEAVAERDALEEELATIDAELDALARASLAKTNDKVTEAMVKNSVQMHKKHLDAFDTVLEAKRKTNLLAALKEAFQQRNYMLKELAALSLASYYEQTSFGKSNLENAKYQRNRERLAERRGTG